ncbi:tubulin--tyrosine ligase-like protein 12 [Sycon ciliatum]|uniref:tubulin--tyrosine ligase-like protein 12 n=1 Tax=Sycon ciliatum TaxID=27933 RepID=UPI0031F6B3B1
MISFEKFSQLHKHQLDSVGLPGDLWRRLFDKLSPSERLDATEKFHIDVSNGATRLIVQDDQRLAANSDVFLSRHLLFSDGNAEARLKLEKFSSTQLKRLESVLCSPPASLPASVGSDGVVCSQLAKLCDISESEASKLLTDSKYDVTNALWRYYDPEAPQPPVPESGADAIPNELRDVSFAEFKQALDGTEQASASEDVLQGLYKEFCRRRKANHEHDRGDVEHITTKYSWTQENEDHPGSGDEGTITVRIPVPKETKKADIASKLSRQRWTFALKGSNPVFDGALFAACIPDESYWTLGKDEDIGVVTMTLQKRDPRLPWEHVIEGEVSLSNRLLSQLDIKREEEEEEKRHRERLIRNLLQRTWLYSQTYQAVTKDGTQRPVWYVMDAHASALSHSDEPNFRCAPFIYALNGQAYSIYWPVKSLSGGEVCSRDYAPALLDVESSMQRRARLWVWNSVHDASMSVGKCPDEFLQALREMRQQDEEASTREDGVKTSASPSSSSDLQVTCVEVEDEARTQLTDGVVNVFLDRQSASVPWSACSLCRVVRKPSEAKWFWLNFRHSEWQGKVSSAHRLNRIDGEECLIDRSLLCYLLRSSGYGTSPWFVPMYDLHRQLAQTMAAHWERGVLSHWLVQPARSDISVGMKTVVTRDVRRVARMSESIPSVALPYNTATDLLDGHRYLLHYTLAVCSVKPLAVFLSLRPVIRLAAQAACDQDLLAEYTDSPGFALPGWSEKDAGLTMPYAEFTGKFKEQHKSEGGVTFDVLQYSISHCLRDVFNCAAEHLSPSCASSLNPIAMYGADFIVDKTQLQAKLLGITAQPYFSAEALDSLVRIMASNKPSETSQQFEDVVQII